MADTTFSRALLELHYHPIANLFPLIERDDFDRLVADIRQKGLRERIIVLDGMILDGRNRCRAALEAGLPNFAEELQLVIEGKEVLRFFNQYDPVWGDPLEWVLSKNLHRRHLSESQRAWVAHRIESFTHGGKRAADEQDANLRVDPSAKGAEEIDLKAPEGGPVRPVRAAKEINCERRERESQGPDNASSAPTPQLDRKHAADLMNVSERSTATAAAVAKKGTPELGEKVASGEISLHAAATLAELPHDEQIAAIKSADPKALNVVVREARERRNAEKKERRAEREKTLGRKILDTKGNLYGLILEDPEWEFAVRSEETGQDRGAVNHYPTSELSEIKGRPISKIAAADCVLAMWTTIPNLAQAFDVLRFRGFTYKSHLVWDKGEDFIGMGFWFRERHELLLIATRGKAVAPAMGSQSKSVIVAPYRGHSVKPPEVIEVLERYFPTIPKIELNRRGAPRPGWAAWGNEVAGDPVRGIAVDENGFVDAAHLLLLAPGSAESLNAIEEPKVVPPPEPKLPPKPESGQRVEFTAGGMRHGYRAQFNLHEEGEGYQGSYDVWFANSGGCGPLVKKPVGFAEALTAGLDALHRNLDSVANSRLSTITDKERAAARAGLKWIEVKRAEWGLRESQDPTSGEASADAAAGGSPASTSLGRINEPDGEPIVPGANTRGNDGLESEGAGPEAEHSSAAASAPPLPDDDLGANYDFELGKLYGRWGKLTMAEAEPALRAGRAAARSPKLLSKDLGHPVGTIKTWLNRLGLTNAERLKETQVAFAATYARGEEDAS